MRINTIFKSLYFFLLCFYLVQSVKAQSKTISGKITGDKEEALAGATVTLKGKGKAVTTDSAGLFTISAAQGDVLIISSVGYTTYDVKVTS